MIGGGIFGAVTAWAAAVAGQRTALIEAGDFGSGSSANSYKVIHGGIRYVQHFDIPRVLSSCRERAAFLRIAPHLCEPLPIVIPTYGWGKLGIPFLGAGCGSLRPDHARAQPRHHRPRSPDPVHPRHRSRAGHGRVPRYRVRGADRGLHLQRRALLQPHAPGLGVLRRPARAGRGGAQLLPGERSRAGGTAGHGRRGGGRRRRRVALDPHRRRSSTRAVPGPRSGSPMPVWPARGSAGPTPATPASWSATSSA